MTKLLLFDAEYTTWEGAMSRGWSGPGEFREIVQFAGLVVDTEKLDISYIDQTLPFQLLIRPTINPILSSYFVHLTGLSNSLLIKNGLSLQLAINYLESTIDNLVLCSWGPDLDVINHELLTKGLSVLSATQYVDYRDLLHSIDISYDSITSGALLNHLNIGSLIKAHSNHQSLSNTSLYNSHNAVYDVLNLAYGLIPLQRLRSLELSSLPFTQAKYDN